MSSPDASGAEVIGITPTPTEEEVAAVLAALEVGLPRPVADDGYQPRPSRWRFSGRWWSKPIPTRRDRP